MAYRAFQINGRADDSGGMVTVDGVVVHSGIFKDGILFEFVTSSTVHGKVDVKVSMAYGSIIIDSVDVTYPAVIGGMTGFISFPQPISQPLQPHMLPLTIDGDIEYSHYAHNGPALWIVDGGPQRYLHLESMLETIKSGSVKLDWQYKHKPIGRNNVDAINNVDDLSELMRGGSSIRSFITPLYRRLRRLYRRLRKSINP